MKLSKELKESILDTMIISVTQNPWIILTFKRSLLNNDLLQYALELEPALFKYLKDPSMPVIMKAVDSDGMNLQYVRPSKITAQMCQIAVKSDPRALQFVPQRYVNEDMIYECIEEDPSLIDTLELNIPDEYFIERLDEHPSLVRYKKDLNEDIVCEAIKRDYNIALYYNTLTDKMKKTLEEYYPNIVHMLPNYR